jgi:hypothetical protein
MAVARSRPTGRLRQAGIPPVESVFRPRTHGHHPRPRVQLGREASPPYGAERALGLHGIFAHFSHLAACVSMAAFFRTGLAAAALAGLTGCAGRPQGTYRSATGTLWLEFKSGRAYLTMQPASALEVPFVMEGDRVTLSVEGEKLVLTRNKDDSLEAPTPIGTLLRKERRAGFPYTINK